MKRGLALFLALVTVFSLLPVSALADDTGETVVTEIEEVIPETSEEPSEEPTPAPTEEPAPETPEAPEACQGGLLRMYYSVEPAVLFDSLLRR